jgi:hypothetical protein
MAASFEGGILIKNFRCIHVLIAFFSISRLATSVSHTTGFLQGGTHGGKSLRIPQENNQEVSHNISAGKSKPEAIASILAMLAEDLDQEVAEARADDAKADARKKYEEDREALQNLMKTQRASTEDEADARGKDDQDRNALLQVPETTNMNADEVVTPLESDPMDLFDPRTIVGAIQHKTKSLFQAHPEHIKVKVLAVPAKPVQDVLWKSHSDVPKWLQYILAVAWVTLLAALPIILPLLGDRAVTKTQMVLAALTVWMLWGGFYLFTNVVVFESSHFANTRSLTIVECIYFMAQTVTTVGYGDIGPANIRGQLFVGFYVVFSLFVIAVVIEDFTEHVIKMAKQAKANIHQRFLTEESTSDDPATIESLIAPPKPSLEPLVASLLVFLFIDVCFIAFFSLHPGENKTVFQATYMSLVTFGSVGFGFFTPLTEAGMIFGAFSMVLGCAAMMFVIGNFVALMYRLKENERFSKAHEQQMNSDSALSDVLHGKDTMNAVEFLQFVLVQSKKVERSEIDNILHVFQNMNPKDGLVDSDMVRKLASPQRGVTSVSASKILHYS